MKKVLFAIGSYVLFCSSVQAIEICSGYDSPGNSYECENNYGGEGNCTWWAAHKRKEMNFSGGGRDAGSWELKADERGLPIGDFPIVGSIALIPIGPVGHVAYVEYVNGDNSFEVSEMDFYYEPGGVKSNTYVDTDEIKFIYPISCVSLYHDAGTLCWMNKIEGSSQSSHLLGCLEGSRHKYYYDTTDGGTNFLYRDIVDQEQISNLCSLENESIELGEFLGRGSVGYGGIGSIGEAPTQPLPNLTVDLDIYADGNRVDDKTVPYDRPLTLKAQLQAEDADASQGIEEGKDSIETEFYMSDDDKQSWTQVGDRQYTQVTNLDEDDTHTESVTVGPFNYAASTVLHFKACTDVEEEVNEGDESDNCDQEFTTLTEPPTYDVVLYDLASGSNIVGQGWGLTFNISNLGNATIPQDFGLVHIVDGTVVGSQRVDNLASGEVRELIVEHTETTTGTKTVEVCYQGGDQFTELSTANNCTRGTLTVNPKPYNLKLHSLTGGTTREGDTWTLQFTIDNEGETLPADIALRVMLGSTRLPNINITKAQLPGYTSKSFQVSGTGPTPGTYTLDVRFEGSSHFTETNVNDNITQSTLTVNHRPQRPTGSVTSYNCSQIKGSASDPNGTHPITVDIYRDNVKKASLSANTSFTYNLDWREKDSTTHTWKVIARDDHKGGDAGDPTLRQFSMKCNNTMPSGNLEHATRTSVHGWAWDPDRPNNPINIHVYTEWGYRGGGNAPHYRADLPGNKYHAFNINVDDLCWGITDGWANVKVAYLDTLSGYRWSNTLNLPCN